MCAANNESSILIKHFDPVPPHLRNSRSDKYSNIFYIPFATLTMASIITKHASSYAQTHLKTFLEIITILILSQVQPSSQFQHWTDLLNRSIEGKAWIKSFRTVWNLQNLTWISGEFLKLLVYIGIGNHVNVKTTSRLLTAAGTYGSIRFTFPAYAIEPCSSSYDICPLILNDVREVNRLFNSLYSLIRALSHEI